jgi:3-hydroxyisobutyrate dehydrogenase-like beta-hydroxyacid dehydrogenase
MKQIGFIGVGRMGHEMVRHLLDNEYDVTVFDIEDENMEKCARIGASKAKSTAELAEVTDCSVIMVNTDDQVKEVVDGLLEGANKDYIIVIASTVHPNTCIELSKMAKEKSVHVVDAPVVFGLAGAIDGTLMSLVGGDQSIVQSIEPVLQCYCEKVIHIGEVGNGQVAKTVNNMLHWSFIVANYEALQLSKEYGIHPAKMREVLLDCPSSSGTLQRWMSHRLTWPHKDMDTVMTLAKEANLSIPLHEKTDGLIRKMDVNMTHGLIIND